MADEVKKAPKTTAPAKAEAAPEPEKTKKECVVSRKEWAGAPLSITVPAVVLPKKDYASGSFGYSGEVTVVIEVGDKPVKAKGHLNLTVANSANAK